MADETPKKKPTESSGDEPQTRQVRTSTLVIFGILALMTIMMFTGRDWTPRSEIDYSYFLEQARDGNVESVRSRGMELLGKFKEAPTKPPEEKDGKPVQLKEHFKLNLPVFARDTLDEELDKHGIKVSAEPTPDSAGTMMLVSIGLTVLLIAVMFYMFRRARDQLSGGGLFGSFSRSGRATL